jgi:DNA-binding response OmpR family regulator
MTKGRKVVKGKGSCQRKACCGAEETPLQPLSPLTTTLPFVIPSAAEGSAVLPTSINAIRRKPTVVLQEKFRHPEYPFGEHHHPMRILIVEDDPKMAILLRDALERRAHRTVLAVSGTDGLDIARNHEFESIILDAMLPGMDGFTVARSLRDSRISTPILMLTARDATRDVVRGLDSGVDDYLTKPFAFEELFARLRALGRRTTSSASLSYRLEDLQLDPLTHAASRNGRPIRLTRTEFLLLEFMMRNPHVVLRREAIINAVWGYERTVENNTLDAFMKQLRSKVDIGSEHRLIHTVRGFGYKLTPEREQ